MKDIQENATEIRLIEDTDRIGIEKNPTGVSTISSRDNITSLR